VFIVLPLSLVRALASKAMVVEDEEVEVEDLDALGPQEITDGGSRGGGCKGGGLEYGLLVSCIGLGWQAAGWMLGADEVVNQRGAGTPHGLPPVPLQGQCRDTESQ
jgi:hypothetical protein